MHFFKTLLGSFYSPAIYAALRKPEGSMKLGYSFLLVMLTSACIVIAGALALHHLAMQPRGEQPPLLDAVLHDLARQVPVMILKNGTLQVKEKQPYTMYLDMPERLGLAPATRAKKPAAAAMPMPFITIDTTGATDMHKMTTPVLVTAREIYVRSKNDTKVYALEKINEKSTAPLIINRAMATDGAERLLHWLHKNSWKIALLFAIPAWIVMTLVTYLLRIIMLMALGLVGLVASRIWTPALSFAQSVRVAAVAYTPVAVLTTVTMCLDAHSPSTLTLFTLGGLMTCVGMVVSREA